MKRNKLLLILAIVVVLTLVLAGCKGECKHEEYDAWKITKAPTAEAQGEAIRVCKACGVAETTAVAALSDTSVWTPTSSTATHVSAGKIVYTSETYGTVEVFVDRLTDHVYSESVVREEFLAKAADCVHAASYRKSCVCGAVGTATFESGNKLGHDVKPVNGKQAIHTADELVNGIKAHFECERCGLLFGDNECTEQITAESVVIVAAHTYGDWYMTSDPATCTVGATEARDCTVCGVKESANISALGHDYTSQTWSVYKTYITDDPDSYNDPEEYHGLKCDRCGEVSHETGSIEEHNFEKHYFAKLEQDVYYGYQDKRCSVCGYENASEATKISDKALTDTSVWERGEEIAPTYETGGSVKCTLIASKGTDEVIVVEYPTSSALLPPYIDATYTVFDVDLTSGNNGNITEGSLSAIYRPASVTFNDRGRGIGEGYPLRGDCVLTVTDQITRAVTLSVTASNDTARFTGYLHHDSGLIAVAMDSYNHVFILTPYVNDNSSSNVKTYLLDRQVNAYVIEYTYSRSSGSQTITMLVLQDKVYFDVTLTPVLSSISSSSALVEVAADGKVIAAFVRGEKGLVLSDAVRGTYTGTQGDLALDGIGGLTLSGQNGVYTINTDGTIDAYIVEDDVRTAHYTIALNQNGYTLTEEKVNVTLNAGTLGTVADTSVYVFTGCELTFVPTVTDPALYDFVGWYAVDGSESGEWGEKITVVNSDVTLYARYAKKITLNVKDVNGGDKTIIVGLTETISSKLPVYTEMSVDATHNTLFGGWFINEACTLPLDEDAMPSESDDGNNIYAKWIPAGYWDAFQNNSSGAKFAYNSDTDTWAMGAYSSTVYYTRFEAKNGDIIISFDYYIKGTGLDYIQIKNNGKIVVAKMDGTAAGAIEPKSFTAVVKAGTKLEVESKRWSTSNAEVCLVNLTINGRKITEPGIQDLKEGTYTCEGKDNLVLDGKGSFTWGADKSGTYVVDSSNVNAVILSVKQGNTVVEGYVATLSGSSYTSEVQKVTVTYHYGEYGYPSADSLKSQAEAENAVMSVETEIFKNYDLPGAPSINGYEFLGWFTSPSSTSLITAFKPTEDDDVYARYVKIIKLTFRIGVDGQEDVIVNGHKDEALGTNLYTIPESVTNGTKVFAGWTLEDGTTAVTKDSKFTDDTVIVAKWVEPVAYMGTWQGYQIGYVNTIPSSKVTLNIDAMGNVTGARTGTINEEGTFIIQGSSKYLVKISDDNSHMVMSINSSISFANAYVLVKISDETGVTDEKVKKVESGWDVIRNDDTVSNNARATLKLVRYQVQSASGEWEEKVFFVYYDCFFADVTLHDGENTVTYDDLSTLTQVTVKADGLDVTLTYNNDTNHYITALVDNSKA